jgi:hypothetical protein
VYEVLMKFLARLLTWLRSKLKILFFPQVGTEGLLTSTQYELSEGVIVLRNDTLCGNKLTLLFESSSVGVATCYWLDGPRIESRWGRDFPYLSDRP